MFVGYLPAKQRVTDLERELKALYEREAELQTKLHQQEELHALRERQLAALSAERDALVKRLEELERELGPVRPKRYGSAATRSSTSDTQRRGYTTPSSFS